MQNKDYGNHFDGYINQGRKQSDVPEYQSGNQSWKSSNLLRFCSNDNMSENNDPVYTIP